MGEGEGRVTAKTKLATRKPAIFQNVSHRHSHGGWCGPGEGRGRGISCNYNSYLVLFYVHGLRDKYLPFELGGRDPLLRNDIKYGAVAS